MLELRVEGHHNSNRQVQEEFIIFKVRCLSIRWLSVEQHRAKSELSQLFLTCV